MQRPATNRLAGGAAPAARRRRPAWCGRGSGRRRRRRGTRYSVWRPRRGTRCGHAPRPPTASSNAVRSATSVTGEACAAPTMCRVSRARPVGSRCRRGRHRRSRACGPGGTAVASSARARVLRSSAVGEVEQVGAVEWCPVATQPDHGAEHLAGPERRDDRTPVAGRGDRRARRSSAASAVEPGAEGGVEVDVLQHELHRPELALAGRAHRPTGHRRRPPRRRRRSHR